MRNSHHFCQRGTMQLRVTEENELFSRGNYLLRTRVYIHSLYRTTIRRFFILCHGKLSHFLLISI